MKRFILAPFAVLLTWLVVAANPASAQNTYPYMPPRYGPGFQTPLSPYLRMLIPGDPAINYYSLVEPQFQNRQFRNQTRMTVQSLASQIPPPPGVVEGDINAPIPSAGHPTAFGYTGGYFAGPMMGQPVGALPMQRRGGAASGQRQAGPSGNRGIWPNMRPSMGPPRTGR